MKILWHRVFALLLAIIALSLVLAHRRELLAVLASPAHIGPGHSPDEQTLGLLTLGIAGVTLVAIVRLLARK